MTISYPINFPTVRGIMNITWRAQRADLASTSPVSFAEQIVRHPGQRWQADVVMPPLERAEGEEFAAFLLRLDGRFGTFLLVPPETKTARGSASTTPGTPVVNLGSQTGNSIDIDGLPLSASGYLLNGDTIQLGTGTGTRLHRVINDVNTNSSGEATLDIWPSLRSSPADGAAVVVSGGAGHFRLSSPDMNWSIDGQDLYGLSFAITEVV